MIKYQETELRIVYVMIDGMLKHPDVLNDDPLVSREVPSLSQLGRDDQSALM